MSEQESPSKRQSKKAATTGVKAFPRFDNSFVSGAPEALPAASSSPPRLRLESASPTPSPELQPMQSAMEESDAVAFVLTMLFSLQSRWVTQVLYQPSRWLDPSETIPDATAARTEPLVLRLLHYRLPPSAPVALQQRWTHAVEQLWQCLVHANSFPALVSDYGPSIQASLEGVHDLPATNTHPQIRQVLETAWERQSMYLYGTVAAALRTMTGLLLRMRLVRIPRVLPQLCGVSRLLEWMISLGVAHPPFVRYLMIRLRYLPWNKEPTLPTQPSSQPDTPISATSTPQSRVMADDATPVHLVSILVTGVQEAMPGASEDKATRSALLVTISRLVRMLAWTLWPSGLHEYVRPS